MRCALCGAAQGDGCFDWCPRNTNRFWRKLGGPCPGQLWEPDPQDRSGRYRRCARCHAPELTHVVIAAELAL